MNLRTNHPKYNMTEIDLSIPPKDYSIESQCFVCSLLLQIVIDFNPFKINSPKKIQPWTPAYLNPLSTSNPFSYKKNP